LATANARLTQLDNVIKWQEAVGSLEDALQRPTDSLAVAIEKLSALGPEDRKTN
jgi:hypothetical protein